MLESKQYNFKHGRNAFACAERKVMKKIISVLLLVCMLIPVMASCGEKKPTGDVTTPSASVTTAGPDVEVTTAVPETTAWPDVPEDINYENYEFTILACTAGSIVFQDFTIENEGYDVVNDAIFRRNSEAEEILGIVLVPHEEYGDVNHLGTDIMKKNFSAAESLYDLCALTTWQAANSAAAGYLVDLNEIPYIDLTQSWWDQRTNIDLGIGGKMFYTNGDIGITDNFATHCILFSKPLAEEKGIKDIYELVLDKKWTWDKLEEYVLMVSEDLNGDDVMNEYDQYGMLCWNDAFQASFGGARSKICSVNADTGALEISMWSDRNAAVAERITTLCFDRLHSINTSAVAGVSTNIGGQLVMFGNGQGLFCTTIFKNVPQLRDVEMDFGIIPYPLYDSEQTEYGGYVSATYSNMYSVEYYNNELERTGVVTEVLACLSRKHVTPAYYEHTLKGREARDEESIKCLDIIFANRSFDPGVFYGVGGYTGSLTDMMKSLSNRFQSIYETSKRPASIKVKNINKSYGVTQ